ncbi:hypothetical protein JCM10207_007214 [Rhodosporidiobolus poonsookiae]
MTSPSPNDGSPLPALSPSTSGPLSPELVQSLHIPWLGLDLPRFSGPTSESRSRSTSSSSGADSSTPATPALAVRSALEQDTLAMRRMKAATARARPPFFRRRSKSLDDADTDDAEQAAREMKTEAAAVAAASAEAIRIEPTPFVDRNKAPSTVMSPMTATSASSFASSAATTVPMSTAASSFATTAPSLFSPCPPEMALSQAGPSAGIALLSTMTRSVSEPMLPSPLHAPAPVGFALPPIRPPQAQPQTSLDVREESSASLTRSLSAHDSRLTTWVNSVSAASSLASLPAPQPVAPPVFTAKFPVPPRQPYTPVLPSPLSTCSYTSNDEDEERQKTPADGFPFPATPVHGAFNDASSSRATGQSAASSPAAASTASAPVISPTVARSAFIPPRPPLHSFGSASTTFTTSSGTTATAAATPSQVPLAPASPARPTRSATISHGAASSSSLPTSRASSPSAVPTRTHIRSASSLSSALPSHTRATSFAASSSSASGFGSGRHAAPLTPPESLCTGPFLAGASASELAWHDVLGARIGSVAAADYSAGGSAGGRAPSAVAQAGGKGDSPGTRTGTGGASPEEEDRKAGSGELMASLATGGFADSTRESLAGLLDEFVGDVPLGDDEMCVNVVEYGAMNSRSSSLIPPVLSHFSKRQLDLLAPPADLSTSPGAISSASSIDPDALLSFQVTHCDKPSSDFRSIAQRAEETYLRAAPAPSKGPAAAIATGAPLDAGLEDRVFSTFAARPFGARVLPKGSVSVGFSAMHLHWPSTDRKFRVAPATLAHGELMAFLSARATEFKPGGLLTLAYISRSEEASAAPIGSPSSMPGTPAGSPPLRGGRSASVPVVSAPGGSAPSSGVSGATGGSGVGAIKPPLLQSNSSPAFAATPRKKDIWAHFTSVLGKAIQRLVSTGLLKPQIARQLLGLPLHPRTPRQTAACLRASAHSWDTLKNEVVVLSHPAWKGVEHGTVSKESWADHTIQLLKIFWEAEMRCILRDALGSRGACEWVLDCLWTVAKEKLEEAPPHPLELEVQLVALRRRSHAPSVPSAPTSPEKGNEGVSLVDSLPRVGA